MKKLLLILFVSQLILITSSCKKKEEEKEPEPASTEVTAETQNTPPSKPIITNGPAEGSTNNETPVTFTWSASTDPDGDDVTYDVYVGTDKSNLSSVSTSQTLTSYTTERLDNQTEYFFKVIANDGNEGTAESVVRTFTTITITASTDFTDSRDGNVYKTVEIGSQIWMKENLRFYLASESFSYDDNISNDATYGRLYSWTGTPSAIPSGWHLPSDDEWKTLESNLGMAESDLNKSGYSTKRGDNQGSQLQNGGTSTLNLPLAGYRDGAGTYTAQGNRTYLWVNTTVNGNAYRRRVVTGEGFVYRFTNPNAGYYISVRLIKD